MAGHGPDLPDEFWHPIDADGNPMEPPGIGLSRFWMLANEHPFFWPAVWHDLQYDLRIAGMLPDCSSDQADWEFRNRCLDKAGTDEDLAWLALAFYGTVVLVGEFRWPKPTNDPKTRAAYGRAAKIKIDALQLMGEL